MQTNNTYPAGGNNPISEIGSGYSSSDISRERGSSGDLEFENLVEKGSSSKAIARSPTSRKNTKGNNTSSSKGGNTGNTGNSLIPITAADVDSDDEKPLEIGRCCPSLAKFLSPSVQMSINSLIQNENMKLAFLAGGVLVSFTIFGYAQEAVTRTKWGEEEEKFSYPIFLIFLQSLTNLVIAGNLLFFSSAGKVNWSAGAPVQDWLVVSSAYLGAHFCGLKVGGKFCLKKNLAKFS
jgi:hypothetical protein